MPFRCGGRKAQFSEIPSTAPGAALNGRAGVKTFMNKKELYPHLINRTLHNFQNSEELNFIMLHTEFPHRMNYRLYTAYSVGSAAVDAMIDFGFKPLDIARSLDFKDRIVEQSMDIIEVDDQIDLPSIMQSRESQAKEKNDLVELMIRSKKINPTG
jgi:hypothetical protein